MDLLTPLRRIRGELLALDTPIDLAAQSAVVLMATVVAWLARNRWNRAVDSWVSDPETSKSKQLVLRGSKRVSFPLTLCLVVLLADGVFLELGRPTGLLDLAVPLTLVLALVRVLVFLLRVAAGPRRGARKLELFFGITLWLGGVLYILGWLPIVTGILDGISVSFGEVRISLFGVAMFLILAVLLVLIAMALSRLAEGRLAARQTLDTGVRMGLVKVVRYGLVVFAVLVALSASGFDLTTLTVIGGALGVGIGFGLQKVTSNLISGFLILFDRSIRPGDVITIGDSYGWVAKMGGRYLVVRDRSGVDTLIPNEELITSQVINWSYADRHIRLKLPVQISYGDDPELAMDLLLQASKASDRVIGDPTPAVRLLGFGDSGINLELRVWIDDPEKGINNVRSDVNLAIWRLFKEHGITIPFPQRDLHVKQGEPA